MDDWQVAIPTFGRPGTIGTKTLAMLAGKVPPERITLYVPDETEADAYRSACDPGLYGAILSLGYDPYAIRDSPPGETAEGLALARNRILAHYPNGTRLVQLDDDLTALESLRPDGKLAPVQDVASLFTAAFALAASNDVNLWGVYPVRNAFFMRPAVRVGLVFCSGGCFGVTTPSQDVTVSCKDDWERSLAAYTHDGGALRLEHVAMKTKVYAGGGGMQATRTHDLEEQSARWIANQWPDLCKVAHRKNGQPELKLTKRDSTLAPTVAMQ